jgi:multicomponent Na+:H+ antiporter subunit B
MSKKIDHYEKSLWYKFRRWIEGDYDPLAPENMEMKIPERADRKTTPVADAKSQATYTKKNIEEIKTEKSEDHSVTKSSNQIENGLEIDKEKSEVGAGYGSEHEENNDFLNSRGIRLFDRVYACMSVLLCACIIAVLLWTTANLPTTGAAADPANNEVSARYIENGLQETGAVNFVTGMILDYRAFDTFGESCVLFISSCCVLVLLRIDVQKNKKDKNSPEHVRKLLAEADDRHFEPKNDLILQKSAMVLVPVIMLFGIYIILNGHLSPGGGFSGGAVLAAGLMLYLNAFGFKKTERFFTEKVYRRTTLCALTFYCLAKSYSFFTGANHLESHIPLGTPGTILSSGLILPLNICVGLVVACTMYAFYTLFRKGGM